jgi:hypothetical protein
MKNLMLQAAAHITIIITTLLWSGMVVGISFLESWVKFKTPSLTRAVGLDVGRTVFHAFHKTQFILLIVLIILSVVAQLSMWDWFALILIAFIFLVQNFWFFSVLSKRVDLIAAGNILPKSKVHALYGILEVLKLVLLLGFSLTLLLMVV